MDVEAAGSVGPPQAASESHNSSGDRDESLQQGGSVNYGAAQSPVSRTSEPGVSSGGAGAPGPNAPTAAHNSSIRAWTWLGCVCDCFLGSRSAAAARCRCRARRTPHAVPALFPPVFASPQRVPRSQISRAHPPHNPGFGERTSAVLSALSGDDETALSAAEAAGGCSRPAPSSALCPRECTGP